MAAAVAVEQGGLSAAQVQRLAELTSQIAQAPGLPTLVARLAQGLSAVVDFDQLALAMRGADGRTWALIRPRLAAGQEPSWLELNDPGSPLEEAMGNDRALRTDRPGTHLLPPGLEATSPIVDLSLFPSAACVPIRGPDGPLGALGTFSARGAAYTAADLHLLQVVTLLVEATARKLVLLDELARTESELHRTDRLRGDLMQQLVADLRSPVQAVKAGLEMMGVAVLTPETRALVDDLRLAAGQLADMTANLTDVGRLEEGQVSLRREPVLLDRLLKERVLGLAGRARAAGVTLLARTEPEASRVTVDPALLGRAVDALVASALAHTPRRGQVALVGRVANRVLTLAVGDTGPAIPPDQRDRLFTKYGQLVGEGELSRPNRALGLYFARLVTELHGGRIAVEEPPAGVGALVRVTMPA